MSSYRLFREFLRDQGCEAVFDRAFYSYTGFTMLDELLWEEADVEYIFAHSFDWRATPEGREFWLDKDRRWNEEIKRNYGTI